MEERKILIREIRGGRGEGAGKLVDEEETGENERKGNGWKR